MKIHEQRFSKFKAASLWVCLLAALTVPGRSSLADTAAFSSNVVQQISALQLEKASFTTTEQKMDSQLIFAFKKSQNLTIAGGAVPQLRIGASADTNGFILVDIKGNVTQNLLKQIVLAGGTIINSYANFGTIRASVPLSQVENIAALADLKSIRPAVGFTKNNSDAEGVVVHKDDIARSTYAVNGTGIKVGVMSDSADFLTQVQNLGNLGPVTVLPGQSGVPGTGEGTAMLEIVHAMAPGAQLFFATADGGEANFAQNIRNLRFVYGCDIIVDDFSYFDESPFQDGIVAQAVNDVGASGGLYFSSAANSGNLDSGDSGTWEGDFSSGGTAGSPVNGKGGLVHSFGTAAYDIVTNPSNEGSPTFLLWSDPLGASTNDYDLYVLDSTGANIVSSSITVQNGSQDPVEFVAAPNQNEQLVIVLASGTGRFLHLDTERGSLAIGTQGSTRGHNATSNMFCVAASPSSQAFEPGAPVGPYPNPFTAANRVEPFSSDGPRRMFYQRDGTPITPGNFSSTGGTVLAKPDIAAADGVRTSTPGFAPFFGTSAAAPHAAAMAALVKSLNPALTVAQVRGILTNATFDIMANGYDRDSGSGIVMADQALALVPTPTPGPDLLVLTNYVFGGNGNGLIDNDECNTFYVALTNAGTATATSVQGILGSTTPGVIIASPVQSYPDIPTNGVATNLNAFQISTSPSFICGTPILFSIITKSDQSSATNFFSVNTGTAGTPVSFSVVTNLSIPDNNPQGASSSLVISNISSALYKVTVSLHIVHPYDSDLTLNLIGPDGTTVQLANNVGGNGQDFGSDCTLSDETTFDDAAGFSINAANAPFIGSFQPAQQLSAFIGREGTNLNGIWQLQLIDGAAGDVGSLQCWTLNLTPSACVDGGGQCPGVDLSLNMGDAPNPVSVFSNLTYTLNITNNGPDMAKSVSLNQTIPASALFVTASTSQGSIAFGSGTVSGNLGSLAPGSNVTVIVVVQPQSAGTIYSTAIVGSEGPELNPLNNTVTLATVVNAQSADLGVTLAANPSPVVLDGILTYTATIVNNGPNDATNVFATNTLPLNVNVISTSATQGSTASAGNLAIANLGTIPAKSNATFTVRVQPFVIGNISATVNVASPVFDPTMGNNEATVSTIVTAASDLSLTLTGPSSVIVGSNIVYQLTVQNFGPSVATGVNVRDNLPSGLVYISSVSSAGTSSVNGNLVSCLITNLPVSAIATVTITASTSNLFNSAPITVLDTASVNADQADGNTNNNSASLSTLVNYPNVNVTGAGTLLAAESFSPTNGMIDPGEQVTVLFRLQNLGNINSGTVVATLQTNGGVIPSGTQTETYGVLAVSGSPVAKPFVFTANSTNGGTITATLALQSGGTNLSPVTFTFNLPVTNGFANTNNIVIPDHGQATPFPSAITVAGVTGIVGKVTVALTNVNHTYPDDVDVLLVGPAGQSVLLMSHTGYNGVLTNTSITFDDAATNADGTTKYLPTNSQILSGTYAPTQNGTVNFGTNAPAAPYGTNLAVFNGTNANGLWKLYVFDSQVGDQGIILGGWKLNISAGTVVNPVVDLSIAGKVTPTTIIGGSNLTYTFTLTNNGPNPAGLVYFSNVLATNVTLVSATNSAQVAISANSNAVYFALNGLPVGSNVTVTVVATASGAGTIATVATVSGIDSDPNQANNTVTVFATTSLPTADVSLKLTGPTNSIVGSNIFYTLTVSNNGPGTALSVIVSNAPNGLNFVSGTAVPAGNPQLNLGSGAVTCNVGNLASGSNATVNLIFTAARVGLVTNNATVSTVSIDSVVTNNTASLVTSVSNAAATIVAAGAHLISGPVNGTIGAGQTVTVSLLLANAGTANTTNLVATLLSANGIVSGSSPQTYGVLVQGGAAVGKTYTFTTTGTNGAPLAAVLQLQDGSNNLGVATFTFNLPATNLYVNSGAIVIPDHGPANPYPSIIVVSNLTGLIAKATVTLSNVSHEFPNDIEALLVGPSGQSVVLFAGVGGSHSISNITLTFDDAATSTLAPSSQNNSPAIVSGTYLPVNFGLSLPFPSPAPAAPFGATLSVFNGTSANGNWTLYIFDNSAGDAGIIANGWSLNLTTVTPINGGADIGVSLVSPTGNYYPGSSFTYAIAITNKGPATATNLILMDTLPLGVILVNASVGSYATGTAGTLAYNLGSLNSGSSTNLTVTAKAATNGYFFNSVTVSSDQTDLYLADNSAEAGVNILTEPKVSAVLVHTNGLVELNLTLSGAPGFYNIIATTNVHIAISNWTTIGTVTNETGLIKFSDTNAGNFPRRYYRAMLIP